MTRSSVVKSSQTILFHSVLAELPLLAVPSSRGWFEQCVRLLWSHSLVLLSVRVVVCLLGREFTWSGRFVA